MLRILNIENEWDVEVAFLNVMEPCCLMEEEVAASKG